MKGLLSTLFIVAAVVVFGTHEAQAQKIDHKRSELAAHAADGASVRVRESAAVSDAVDNIEAKARRKEIEGYRVVIFSANGQYAGDNARTVLETFQTNHPHIIAYMEEASHLMSQLVGEYPELFPKREMIKYNDLGNVRRRKIEVPDTLNIQ